MRSLLIGLLSLVSTLVVAQTGTIRGTIIDDKSGEPLIGVTVRVVDQPAGAYSDLDGSFSIEIAPGNYTLKFNYLSYEELTMEEVEVKADEVNSLGTVRLGESSVELEGVTVTAKVNRKSEAALLTQKKNATNLVDGISAEKMEQTGDGNAVEAAKRVTGVSVEGGKYVYIRGLGDRYTKTSLNGIDIPGLDPDKNTIQMDIFPTNLMDNLIVSKNFTADLPADFTGGLLNIQTKDFPSKKFMNVSLGFSYNPQMNLNPENLYYEGGNTDFLGFDDGTRALPEGANEFPYPTRFLTDDEKVNEFVNSFDKELAAKERTSPLNYSLGFSFGDQIDLPVKDSANYNGQSNKLGYIFSLSYKDQYEYYDDIVFGEFQRFPEEDRKELRFANIRNGRQGERNVLVGLLGGVAFKTSLSKYRLTVMRLQNGESAAGQYRILDSPSAVGTSGYEAESDNLLYTERSLTNVLLHGKHVIDTTGWEIDWKLSPTFSTSDDPDLRNTTFTITDGDPSFQAGQGGNPSRIWRSLSQLNATAKIDLTKKYDFNGEDAKLKFGAVHTYKQRDYEIVQFDAQFRNQPDWPSADPGIVLNPEYIFDGNSGLYYNRLHRELNPNAYESNVNSSGLYVSNEMNVTKNLKSVLGVRAEYYVQRHTGRDQAYANGDFENGNNLDNEKVLDALDFFPSINLIYTLIEDMNLRASYSRTIARPSFKELSFAQILDPTTNRVFNGALFPYEGWNGELVSTRINNIDLRWEWYGEGNQIYSASVFYKGFDNPIEIIRLREAQTITEVQPRNVGDAQLFGVEFEIRKSLGFISESIKNIGISTNITLVESMVQMTENEFTGRKIYEKEGQTIDDERAMSGQAPWVVNAGITYDNEDLGLNTGLFYNVKGPTLFIVGNGLVPDVYQEPFHSLNFSISKKLGEDEKSTIDFQVDNILGDMREWNYQSFEASDRTFEAYSVGTTFSVGYSYKFY